MIIRSDEQGVLTASGAFFYLVRSIPLPENRGDIWLNCYFSGHWKFPGSVGGAHVLRAFDGENLIWAASSDGVGNNSTLRSYYSFQPFAARSATPSWGIGPADIGAIWPGVIPCQRLPAGARLDHFADDADPLGRDFFEPAFIHVEFITEKVAKPIPGPRIKPPPDWRCKLVK